MKQNLVIIMLLAIILAMAIPFTFYHYSSEPAFTPDNIISISPNASSLQR